MKVLVTGSKGFIGRHICEALGRQQRMEVISFDEDSTLGDLKTACSECDAIVHLAGVNRPPSPEDFDTTNRGLTQAIADTLVECSSKAKILFSSSIQAELDNPYGASKKAGEHSLIELCERQQNPVAIFRLPNVFGKWARPNYNSAVATFAYNIGKGLPIQVNDPTRIMELVYIDDVVQRFVSCLHTEFEGVAWPTVEPVHRIPLGDIVRHFESFRESRTTLVLPDFADPLIKKLYATYISYLDGPSREYSLDIKSDQRGSLAEFIKSASIGQVFVSRTFPGVTRGNHYHHTKPEKFLVLEGQAIVRFRHIESNQVEEHHVRGEDYRVIDITPGWTHSIENVGDTILITLFWAGEFFNPAHPDTYFVPVLQTEDQP